MNRIKTTVLPRAGPVVFQPSRSRDLDGQPDNGFMQQRHSHEKRCGKVREDGRMERSPRRLFRSQGLHLPEGEDAGVGNYFLECVRPAEDWPEPINNLPNRISHEVSSCPFPKRSVAWKIRIEPPSQEGVIWHEPFIHKRGFLGCRNQPFKPVGRRRSRGGFS